ncbi:MAG: peptide-methionine (R)-S-oxide reductase MsrB [Alphaproteobacteria bacterium]|nr:peptide-methionine (R)-S-oxide reductase MsrB [Alphaproteobacteria bacterium]
MTTRRLLLLSAAGLAAAACSGAADGQEPAIPSAANEARYANDPFRRLTAEQWRARLSPAAFDVLRQEGTERAGTSALNAEHRRGVFHCAGCDLPLFDSRWKFDSGTGWPSFFRANRETIATKVDNRSLFGARTEYHCARCLGHQGHVFPDGPRPTGLRYCNNGVALRFVPA